MSSFPIPYSVAEVRVAIAAAQQAQDALDQYMAEHPVLVVDNDDFFAFIVAALVARRQKDGCEDMASRVNDAVYRYSDFF